LYEAHRHWLTVGVIVLAGINVLLARYAQSIGRVIFSTLGLALITGGVAVTFTGNTITLVWIIEAAVLGWIGLQLSQHVVRVFSFASFCLGGFAILLFPPSGGAAFHNERFLTLLLFAAGLFIVRIASHRYRERLVEIERVAYVVYEPIAHLFTITAFSFELYNFTHQNDLSLTLFWLAYAASLFVVGIVRHSAFRRWEGFALLSIAILKAFVVDMSAVNPGIRIISFLVLGSAMLAISYVYQRYTKGTPGSTP
jgi:uncharacterized membrane protein